MSSHFSAEALLHLRNHPEEWPAWKGILPFWFCYWLVLRAEGQVLDYPWEGMRKIERRFRARSNPRKDLEEALSQLGEVHSIEVHLVWLLLVLEHGSRAVDGLLKRMAEADEFVANGCIWALSRLGRESFYDLKDLYRKGSPRLRERIVRLLFMLGQEARGCEQWLEEPTDPWTLGVLMGLGPRASESLVGHRQKVTILSHSARSLLAELFFGHSLEDRRYALTTLHTVEPSSDLSRRLHRLAFLEFDPVLSPHGQSKYWEQTVSELDTRELLLLLLEPGVERQRACLLGLFRRDPDFQSCSPGLLEATVSGEEVMRQVLLRMLELFTQKEVHSQILSRLLLFRTPYPSGARRLVPLLEQVELEELVSQVCVQMCGSAERALEACPELLPGWIQRRNFEALGACITHSRVLEALQSSFWQNVEMDSELMQHLAPQFRLPLAQDTFHLGRQHFSWLEGHAKEGLDFLLRYLEDRQDPLAVEALGSWLCREPTARLWLLERGEHWLDSFKGTAIEGMLAQTLQWILVSLDEQIAPEIKTPWVARLLEGPIDPTVFRLQQMEERDLRLRLGLKPKPGESEPGC